MNLLIETLILSLFCNGLKIATEEGMIFYRPAKWLMKLPNWINKPLVSCVYCMASVWGVVVHSIVVFYSGSDLNEYILLPILIVCGVFANGFVRLVYEILMEHWQNLKHGFGKNLDLDEDINEGIDN